MLMSDGVSVGFSVGRHIKVGVTVELYEDVDEALPAEEAMAAWCQHKRTEANEVFRAMAEFLNVPEYELVMGWKLERHAESEWSEKVRQD